MCGHRRKAEPFILTIGMTVPAASRDMVANKARELLRLLEEQLESDSVLWIEDIDDFSDSDKLVYYTEATHGRKGGDFKK